jgi:peptidoglycan hydrolase-like protein with peptidoglycan-binding domain
MVSHSRTVQPVAPKPAVQRAAPVGDSAVTPLTRANAVYRIQKALQQRGYNPGEIDGRLGPSTVKALTAFQESKGLKTGTLDRDTLRALNLVQ